MIGESYGTIRAPEVGAQLAELAQPILLDGIILMGQAANIVEYAQRPANILSYVLSLPTLAAIGWYHDRINHAGRTLDQLIAEAQQYAGTAYLDALFRGNTLPAKQKTQVAARLEALSGIPAAFYLAHNLRITKEQYRVELLKDQGLLLGRVDARYTAPIGPTGLRDDPAEHVLGRINDFFAAYLRDDLKIDWPEPYLTNSPITDKEPWDYGGTASPFSDWPFPQRINELMAANPKFRIFVANGDYDTQTTIGAAAYLVAQAGWPKERTSLHFYRGGHMPYTVDATARLLGADIRAFVRPAE